jgi:hypothetical protein
MIAPSINKSRQPCIEDLNQYASVVPVRYRRFFQHQHLCPQCAKALLNFFRGALAGAISLLSSTLHFIKIEKTDHSSNQPQAIQQLLLEHLGKNSSCCSKTQALSNASSSNDYSRVLFLENSERFC